LTISLTRVCPARLDPLLVLLDQAVADLLLQLLERVGLAGVLGQLVVQGRLLALAGLLDGDVQVDVLAGQALDLGVLADGVLDLQVVGGDGTFRRRGARPGHAAGVLVGQVDHHGVLLHLVLADAAVHLHHQHVDSAVSVRPSTGLNWVSWRR
jgi:hypothetical protein